MSSESHCDDGVVNFIRLWLNRLSSKRMMLKLRMDAGFNCNAPMKSRKSYPNVSYKINCQKLIC